GRGHSPDPSGPPARGNCADPANPGQPGRSPAGAGCPIGRGGDRWHAGPPPGCPASAGRPGDTTETDPSRLDDPPRCTQPGRAGSPADAPARGPGREAVRGPV